MSSPSSRERAQGLYEKALELENKRQKAAKARIPSDPNAWQQIRENYEAIILEDHTFSEQHSIEYALWQLHYKRIEEFRAHLNVALTSANSNTIQTAKGSARPDRIAKLRAQFKTFLSEATGFYHDLILKVRSKYGLPLGYISEDSENKNVADKDGNKSKDLKKGLVSCHRCLIYLGDLARYKGLYGEGDSKTREYAAASSYYLQAASLLPPSGNPHHQLAILASYAGDELVSVYCYFRSLAVESPFPTARDNLIVSFEKNRLSYSQLLAPVEDSSKKLSGKGRGKMVTEVASKEFKMEAGPAKDKVSGRNKMYKSFCIRFIRLNGILFTRTSLETFSEVLTSVSSELQELLSSGTEEKLNFGADVVENALFIVRLVAILIFTVHNSKKESEGQTYSELVQHPVLSQNSCTAIFELIAHIVERCSQLHDPSSSYLLPGILVFVEWLACCPDVSAGSDVDEKLGAVRSKFWNHCISFLNKILSTGPAFVDDSEDETCFSNMTKYDERETENRLALWEDFELRGFLPVLPAQTILDFSRKYFFASEGNKEKKARMKRIVAAGKVLAGAIRIDQSSVYFDSRMKKFLIGSDPTDDSLHYSHSSPQQTSEMMQNNQANGTLNFSVMHQNQQPCLDGEDEDEVIVFKPVIAEKRSETLDPVHIPSGSLMKSGHSTSAGNLHLFDVSHSASHINHHLQADANTSFQIPVSSVGGNLLPNMQPALSHVSNWSSEIAVLAGSLTGVSVQGNGHLVQNENRGVQGLPYFPHAQSLPIHQSFDINGVVLPYAQSKALESVMTLKNGAGLAHSQSRVLDTLLPSNDISISYAHSRALTPSNFDAITSQGLLNNSFNVHHTASAPSLSSRKSPVSRPVRHLGPPPGFNPVPSKQLKEPISGANLNGNNPLVDDYSWLDGYQPQSTRGLELNQSLHYSSHGNTAYNNAMGRTVDFPFPGKQVLMPQAQVDVQKGWQTHQQLQQQQFVNGTQQSAPLPEQYQGQSAWPGRHFV